MVEVRLQYRNRETIDERVHMGTKHDVDRKKGKWNTLSILSAD